MSGYRLADSALCGLHAQDLFEAQLTQFSLADIETSAFCVCNITENRRFGLTAGRLKEILPFRFRRSS